MTPTESAAPQAETTAPAEMPAYTTFDVPVATTTSAIESEATPAATSSSSYPAPSEEAVDETETYESRETYEPEHVDEPEYLGEPEYLDEPGVCHAHYPIHRTPVSNLNTYHHNPRSTNLLVLRPNFHRRTRRESR